MMLASKPRLLFVATEDWFFCSHFLPMAEAAKAAGYDVAVACRVKAHGDLIEAQGFSLFPFTGERKSLNLFHIGRSVLQMRTVMKSYQPDVVHLIALRSVIVGGLAARLVGVQNRIIALTGLGFIGASSDSKAKALGWAIKKFIKYVVDDPSAHYLFENPSDQEALGLKPDHPRITVVGGAGVDPAQFKPSPLPVSHPLRIAFVGRMVWSKGVDQAVEATRKLRAQGVDVQLSLFGEPDLVNPRAIAVETLQDWASEKGISWHGAIKQSEVNVVWANHHCAVLASRGGEGLPRSLLEAAACGRAIITTDVPGCRDLVRDGVVGFVVPVEDVNALAAAIKKFHASPDLSQTMGDAARQRILSGYTIDHLKMKMQKLYQSLLA